MGTKSLANLVKTEISRVVFYQFLIMLGFTLLIFLLKGMQSGLSALAGAFSYWLPTFLFIWRVSTQVSARAGMRFLATFMVGEGVKLLLCGILFVFFIKYFHIQTIDAVIGLAGAIVAFWLASAALIFKKGAKS
jgi:F0F1-type ATP synthase assembly protein I